MKKLNRASPTVDSERRGADPRLFTLTVYIISGPVSDKFVKKNGVMSRTIEIRGDQTLRDLHRAIFEAFNREDEHMYEFQVGGKGTIDPNAKRYVLPSAMALRFAASNQPAGDVTRTTLGLLRLEAADHFIYWFDFGDDWRHQIDVEAVSDKVPKGKLPRVINRVGESPPQYIDWDEEG
ncbi:MAG: plasmid pRiA4b ORF-3 family protein [Planctomycetes bacterium]|nr:plasmid pRiA4b ORF-3 family protein [Planctomycetota bacterium]MBI3845319.1 plasmid pRiA4b ORF-3 family protein [Planctomycetota bacterium]